MRRSGTAEAVPGETSPKHTPLADRVLGVRNKPGRKPLAEEDKVVAERRPIRLQVGDWAAIEKLAVELNIRSSSGPKTGSHSWRALIRFIAQNAALVLIGIKVALFVGPEHLQAILDGTAKIVAIESSETPS